MNAMTVVCAVLLCCVSTGILVWETSEQISAPLESPATALVELDTQLADLVPSIFLIVVGVVYAIGTICRRRSPSRINRTL